MLNLEQSIEVGLQPQSFKKFSAHTVTNLSMSMVLTLSKVDNKVIMSVTV